MTDVGKRLLHKIRPLAPPEGLLSDAAKIRNNFETCKDFGIFFSCPHENTFKI
jgi:hypothetical protein